MKKFSSARILVVEDQAMNRELLVELLDGLAVDVAVDGVEAVDLAALNRYDLILMDIRMPHMDGLEAARRIRQLPGCACVPIVALTAYAFDEDRRRCMEAGMDDFLAKPVYPAQLSETVLKWLSPRGTD
jgi:CheY-like chemotaxis protein